MSTRLADYDYELPRELIAQHPLPRREDSRMMVLDRATEKIEHARFADLKGFLRVGDQLVMNNSRVLAARQFSDDGKLEFLFLEKIAPHRWKALVKPAKKFRKGVTALIKGVPAEAGGTFEDGAREIVLSDDVDLQRSGAIPLPPYIKRSMVRDRRYRSEDETRYQTVFAERDGSLAAPTAGLHFTPEILRDLPHAFITLHVGTGTFRPVKTDDITQHQMHAEKFSISEPTADAISRASRIIAVGTTTARVLEYVHRMHGKIWETEGETNIFIYPPFEFRVVDVLLTNFHLPQSTLLMLVSAFAGRDFILRAYDEAARERYRFFSYGDCMLIL